MGPFLKSPHRIKGPGKLSPFTLRACLHGGGGPQVGEVNRLGGATRLSTQSLILM